MAAAAVDLAHIHDVLLQLRDEAEGMRAAMPAGSSGFESLLQRIEMLLEETEDALDIQEAELSADEPSMPWNAFEATLDPS